MPATRKRLILTTAALTLVLAGAAAAIGGAVALWSGWYNVGADAPHLQPVHSLLEIGMHRSVQHHARDIETPRLSADMAARGAAVFVRNCQACHGAPGISPEDFGKSIQPVPGPLVDASRRWKPRELYWITRHGIKMTAMPAWEYHLADEDLWNVVAFMQLLPRLTPEQYAAYAARNGGAK